MIDHYWKKPIWKQVSSALKEKEYIGPLKNDIQSSYGIMETVLFLCASAVMEMINLSVCT